MKIKSIFVVSMTCVFFGCNNNPKVIPVTSNNANPNSSNIFSGSSSSTENVDFNAPASNEFHSVVVNEILPTSKYIYLNVTEGEETYWLATRSMEAKVGETYYYKEGLLKTNFESKEYNRVFDKVYLIGSLVSANHANTVKVETVGDYSNTNQSQKEDIPMHAEKMVQTKGSIKIANLVKDPKKYEGKTIQLDGICTKINAGIMDRNWIHIKDGSQDDFDLVITTDAYVPEGAAFTMKAVVVLNKDFGAGYKYDLILEQGVIVK
ncbi:MAG: hypothetical protein GW839_05660 [Flavobacteriales bacterium]|nr:hypothetical protein [Flavobacteriia bacterium]NCP05459.1 hypothetical protein [Flavobacteriales bacterium]PIV93155.1 MAG: hypothetical protein COW44_10890 [Flavobacteriaceae bacterium CG17_big_fil_post_rev_8_21_14_2_50_33_15]PIY09883.1 MAG: hypothetical protein COZ17_11600 [Flavobacteriaceae bacterium CG_4_10_14_3_um_filter_33_47]PJB17895.1 MAG: hypothetical protein CO117_09760 [Flavobacteriaceae bacterium CG_4_9_14_3_um_filter_33_16]